MDQQNQDKLPTLLVTKSEAKKLLNERIIKGNRILELSGDSETSLGKFKDELEKWDNFNVLLFGKIFLEERASQDYLDEMVFINTANKKWYDELFDRKKDLRERIKFLEQAEELIDILNEPTNISLSGNKGNSNIAKATTPIVSRPHKTHIEKRPLGLSPELFWTIFTAFVTAVFYFGFQIGQAKFDKEKSDYYEQQKVLGTENTSLKQRLVSVSDSVNILKSKNDSLSHSLIIKKLGFK